MAKSFQKKLFQICSFRKKSNISLCPICEQKFYISDPKSEFFKTMKKQCFLIEKPSLKHSINFEDSS